MVWCGFIAFTIIRPFFFKEMHDFGFETVSLTSERYANMLLNRIIPNLADKHLLVSTNFMQDGALLHIPKQVKDRFYRSFGDD